MYVHSEHNNACAPLRNTHCRCTWICCRASIQSNASFSAVPEHACCNCIGTAEGIVDTCATATEEAKQIVFTSGSCSSVVLTCYAWSLWRASREVVICDFSWWRARLTKNLIRPFVHMSSSNITACRNKQYSSACLSWLAHLLLRSSLTETICLC